MQIAIDGPAGVGKSTLAKALAGKLGYIYLDTGAMYRGVTLMAQRAGISAEDEAGMEALLKTISLSFRFEDGKKCLFEHDENIEDAIRMPDISAHVSAYASLACVRTAMTNQQRRIASECSVIMDGRDIGTVVLPQADFKFFLTASVEERARRRYLEMKEKGIEEDYEEYVKKISLRDQADASRKIAPLKQAEDAIVIDTDTLNEAEVLEKILSIIEK